MPPIVAIILTSLALMRAPACASTAIAAPDGAVLYLENCASCHGIGGRGDGPDANLFLPGPRDLRTELLDRYETAEIVRRVMDGARLVLVVDPSALRAQLQNTEAIVAHLESIPDTNWHLVRRGQDLYLARCESCHGAFGRPPWTDPPSRAPDLSSPAFQRSLSDQELVRAVRHGRPDMPAIPVLGGDADAGALVAFVRILSPGFELYTRHCAACHGADGRPPREFVEPRERPPVTFDADYLARRDPGQLRAAVSHMLAQRKPGMPHFRNDLGESEVRAIVEHLRTR
jgi:mono/diheme cytochrome c family protein